MIHQEERSREADLGWQSIDTIKLEFKESEVRQTLVHSQTAGCTIRMVIIAMITDP